MTKPPSLKKGDTIGIIAPSGPFRKKRFEQGCAIIEGMGFIPKFSQRLFERQGYLAGSDKSRIEELHSAFTDTVIKAVWCVRGGYGAMRILEELDSSLIKANPKLFIGFSDATALHCAIHNLGNIATLHAPMVHSLPRENSHSLAHLKNLLTSMDFPYEIPFRGEPLIKGSVSGELAGGNLSLLTRLVGTPFEPDFSQKILFLEEIDERPYRIDRMLTHLRLAGKFKAIKGIIFGHFLKCDDPEGTTYGGEELQLKGSDTIRDFVQKNGVPSIKGFPAGHGKPNIALPLGCRITLDAERGTVVLEEAVVS